MLNVNYTLSVNNTYDNFMLIISQLYRQSAELCWREQSEIWQKMRSRASNENHKYLQSFSSQTFFSIYTDDS